MPPSNDRCSSGWWDGQADIADTGHRRQHLRQRQPNRSRQPDHRLAGPAEALGDGGGGLRVRGRRIRPAVCVPVEPEYREERLTALAVASDGVSIYEDDELRLLVILRQD